MKKYLLFFKWWIRRIRFGSKPSNRFGKVTAAVHVEENKWLLYEREREFAMFFEELPKDIKVKIVLLKNTSSHVSIPTVGIHFYNRIFIFEE